MGGFGIGATMRRYLYRADIRVLSLDIKAKQNHITILHHVIAPFHLHQPGGFDGVAILKLLKDRERDDLGTNETAFKIRMDHTGGLWCCPMTADRPGPYFIFVVREITDQIQ